MLVLLVFYMLSVHLLRASNSSPSLQILSRLRQRSTQLQQSRSSPSSSYRCQYHHSKVKVRHPTQFSYYYSSAVHSMSIEEDSHLSISMRDLDTFAAPQSSVHKYLVAEAVVAESGLPVMDYETDYGGGKRLPANLPRQVKNIHYTPVLPETAPAPYLVAASKSCATMLELDTSELHTTKFVNAFSGNLLLPRLNRPYCTVYGCHSYGQWFGQLGDGRAIGLGEVYVQQRQRTSVTGSSSGGGGFFHDFTRESPVDAVEEASAGSVDYYSQHLFELQLKGSGRSPYSRGFDGRAVLRSSVREYLVSEAMHHLGVPTTRALCIVGTGIDIRRPWYAATSQDNPYTDPSSAQGVRAGAASSSLGKFSPDVLLREPGAVLCRVSPSFLRFGHLELFAKRGELKELLQLADYVCFRDYPHLLHLSPEEATMLPEEISQGSSSHPERYVELFRCVAKRTSELVANWLRVGYVQGNMNSDNTLLAGRTLDYGPFGWLEKYDPLYQPFTSDGAGNFAFMRQPTAMGVNVRVLGETAFTALIKYSASLNPAAFTSADVASYLRQIEAIAQEEYPRYFHAAYDDVKARKLGLLAGLNQDLWSELEKLMLVYGCDYTILFRELGKVAELATSDLTSSSSSSAPSTNRQKQQEELVQQAYAAIVDSFYEDHQSSRSAAGMNLDAEDDWCAWIRRYQDAIRLDTERCLQAAAMATNSCDAIEGTSRISEVVGRRRAVQSTANPKYVLRNWMGLLAYERAAAGDYSVVEELTGLLEKPYDEQDPALSDKWYAKTPDWARFMPGVTFMS